MNEIEYDGIVEKEYEWKNRWMVIWNIKAWLISQIWSWKMWEKCIKRQNKLINIIR